MFRKTLTILSLLGLLLNVGLWGVSLFGFRYSWITDPNYDHESGLCYPNGSSVSLENGILLWTRGGLIAAMTPSEQECPDTSWQFGERELTERGYRFSWWKPEMTLESKVQGLVLPMWIPMTVFSLSCLWCYIPVYRRRERTKLGLCAACGYDLRGSVERCPECGTIF